MKAKLNSSLSGHSGSIYALAFDPSEKYIFSGGADKVVAKWDLELGINVPFAVKTEASIYSLLTIDQVLVVGCSNGSIHIIDLEKKQEIRHLKVHKRGVFHLMRSAERSEFYACGEDGTISVWNIADYSLKKQFSIGGGKVRRCALSHDGVLLAVASNAGYVHVLETNTYRNLYEIAAHTQGCTAVCWLGHLLLTGGKDAHICAFDKQDGFKLVFKIPAHNFSIYDLLSLDNSKHFASVSRDKNIKLWHVDDLQHPIRLDRKSYEGHIHSVNRALWSASRSTLISAGDDRQILVWDLAL